MISTLFLPAGLALTCLVLAVGTTSAGETAIDLTATPPRIYKSEETLASSGPNASGKGVRLEYDFEKGGNSVRYEFLLSPPLEGPISRLTVKAKGSEGSLILMVRDAKNQGLGYTVGPITGEEQIFTIELANPIFQAGRQSPLEYPLKAIGFTQRKSADPKGFVEISELTAEHGN